MPTFVCPSTTQLEGLLAGKASAEEVLAFREHLLVCPLCESRAADLISAESAGTHVNSDVSNAETSHDRPAPPPAPSPPSHPPSRDSLTSALEEDAAVLEMLDPPRAPGEPRCVGKYRVLRVLGRGGMGVVFEAEDPDLGRRVAVKLMRPARRSPALVERFLREAQASARFRHPNLVTIYNVDQTKGAPYISMELLDGPDLDECVYTHGPMDARTACEAIRQAARGLAHAHSKGVVHRDVKPNNLMYDGELVKVLDLGVARMSFDEAATRATAERAIVGTPAYMAPEQLVDAHHVDARADVYSLGGTLHYLLSGKPPRQSIDMLNRVLRRSAADEAMVPPECPPALAPTLRRMLALNPAERFASMEEVVAALDEYLAGAAPRAKVAPLAYIASAVVGVVLLLVALSYAFSRSSRDEIEQGNGPLNAGATALASREPRRPGESTGFAETAGFAETQAQAAARSNAALKPMPPAPSIPPAPLLPKLGAWPLGRGSALLPGFAAKPSDFPGVKNWQVVGTGPREWLSAVAWSPDGRTIACCGDLDTVRLYDADTLALRAYFTTPTRQTGKALAWSRDSQRLAYGTAEGTIRVFDSGLTPRHAWQMLNGAVDSLEWSPDGIRLLSSNDKAGVVELWDSSGVVESTFRLLDDKLLGAAFNRDGLQVATGSTSGRIRIWNRLSGKPRSLATGDGPVRVVGWSSDERWIATLRVAAGSAPGEVRLWPADGAGEARSLGAARGFAWRPDGRSFATFNAVAVQLAALDGRPLASFNEPSTHAVIGGVGFSPSGASVAVVKPYALSVFDARGQRLRTTQGVDSGTGANLAWSPDGRYLACGAANAPPAVWSEEGLSKARLNGRRGHFVSWSRDGRNLAFTDAEQSPAEFEALVRSWRPDGGEGTTWKNVGDVWELARTPEGGIQVGRPDGSINSWGPTGQRGPDFLGAATHHQAFAWNPAGDRFAAADNDGAVRFWDRRGSPEGVGRDESRDVGAMFAVAWKHDGSLLLTGRRNALTLWKEDGAMRRPFAVWGNAGSEIRAVAWTADDQRAVAASRDFRVGVFRASDGAAEQSWTRPQYGSYLKTAALHPDGRRLATLDRASLIHVHDLFTGDVLWTGVNLAGGPLALSPAGEILDRRTPLIESELRYVVERDDGGFDLLTPTQFAVRLSLAAAAGIAPTQR